MNEDRPNKSNFNEIKAYYNSIPSAEIPSRRFNNLKEKFEQLQGLKDDLGHDKAYTKA